MVLITSSAIASSTCRQGVLKNGKCVIEIPVNAKPGYYGGWTCIKGYQKRGNECAKVRIPKNGKLNYYGNNWTCVKGFYKSGSACKKVMIPMHGKLNYYGNDWTCIKGYQKSANSCRKVVIPENGKLNYFGNDWTCIDGFRKARNGCVKMSQSERSEAKARTEAIEAKIRNGKRFGYEIEHNVNDEHLIINGEKFEAQTYCLGFEEGDRVMFIEGSPFGACASAKLLHMETKETCDVWCE